MRYISTCRRINSNVLPGGKGVKQQRDVMLYWRELLSLQSLSVYNCNMARHYIPFVLVRTLTVKQYALPDDGAESGYSDRRSETENGDACRAEMQSSVNY